MRSVLSQTPLPVEAVEHYAGKWIAIREGRVIAAADELVELVADERVNAHEDVIYHVPETSTYFY